MNEWVFKLFFLPGNSDTITKEELCPHMDATLPGRDLDTANYPYKAIFKFYPYDDPDFGLKLISPHHCFFYSGGPNKKLNVAHLRAIQLSLKPWDFGTKPSCQDHIKISSDNVNRCQVPFNLEAPFNSTDEVDFQNSFLSWEKPRGALNISLPSLVGFSNFTQHSPDSWLYLHLLYVLILGMKQFFIDFVSWF